MKIKLSSPRDHLLLWFSVPSFLPNFFTATNSKDRPAVDERNSAKCRANLLAEHWTHWTTISNVRMPSLWVLRSNTGGLQIPLPTGLSRWAQWRQTSTFQPLPLITSLKSAKNLADTWPAVIRVLSRGRESTLGTRLHFWRHFEVIGSIIFGGLHFWRHWFNMAKILSNFGEQQLVMVNYACGFNQSEMGKYFEWIIINN